MASKKYLILLEGMIEQKRSSTQMHWQVIPFKTYNIASTLLPYSIWWTIGKRNHQRIQIVLDHYPKPGARSDLPEQKLAVSSLLSRITISNIHQYRL